MSYVEWQLITRNGVNSVKFVANKCSLISVKMPSHKDKNSNENKKSSRSSRTSKSTEDKQRSHSSSTSKSKDSSSSKQHSDHSRKGDESTKDRRSEEKEKSFEGFERNEEVDENDLRNLMMNMNETIQYLADTQGRMRERMDALESKRMREETMEYNEIPEDSYENYESHEYEQMLPYKRARYEEEEEDTEDSNEDIEAQDQNANSEANPSRFDNLANYLKTEKVSENLDERLANHINITFKKGISDKVVDEDTSARPANCEGLKPVKVNPMIWESITKSAKLRDLKATDIQQNLSKAASIVAKVVQSLAINEEKLLKAEGNDLKLEL